MSWFLLEGHQNFVSAWDLIYGISQASGADLVTSAHLLVRLNELDPMDGCYAIPFYGYRKFDGYFLASKTETDLCIDALKKAILFNVVSIFDGEGSVDIPLSDGLEEQKGMDFFFKKADVIKTIDYKSRELGVDIPLPACIVDFSKTDSSKSDSSKSDSPKLSKKTENAKSRFIKNLLTVMYGEDVSNSPRKYIDGIDSQIRNDMNAKGLVCPSGCTVEKWLSDID
ncbi:hypothetical protein NMD88_03975 [Edwardsiella tarda]|uniref:hypothetical protein n=1 Tax=Edwardsiella tarda TaxID=636 RepID=UPI00351C0CAC